MRQSTFCPGPTDYFGGLRACHALTYLVHEVCSIGCHRRIGLPHLTHFQNNCGNILPAVFEVVGSHASYICERDVSSFHSGGAVSLRYVLQVYLHRPSGVTCYPYLRERVLNEVDFWNKFSG